jgi:hypothetical protein
MSTFGTGRTPHKVMTTMDKVVDFAATVGVSGSATALSCSLLYSTEQHCTVSGTSPGVVYLAFPKGYSPARMIAWGATMHAGSTSSLDFGGRDQLTKAHYVLEPVSYVAPYGNMIASSSVGMYSNPGNMTDPRAAGYDGGAYFKFEIKKLVQASGTFAGVAPVSATLADPIDASVASGWPTAKISVWAKFRDRARDNGY